jgi:hypothetical protein
MQDPSINQVRMPMTRAVSKVISAVNTPRAIGGIVGAISGFWEAISTPKRDYEYVRNTRGAGAIHDVCIGALIGAFAGWAVAGLSGVPIEEAGLYARFGAGGGAGGCLFYPPYAVAEDFLLRAIKVLYLPVVRSYIGWTNPSEVLPHRPSFNNDHIRSGSPGLGKN